MTHATGYKYAGVQAGYACLCGDTFGKHGKERDTDCDSSTCPGDNTQKCGAGWRNAIYSTGYMGMSLWQQIHKLHRTFRWNETKIEYFYALRSACYVY